MGIINIDWGDNNTKKNGAFGAMVNRAEDIFLLKHSEA